MMTEQQINATAANIHAKAVQMQAELNNAKAEAKTYEKAAEELGEMLHTALIAMMPLDKAMDKLAVALGNAAMTRPHDIGNAPAVQDALIDVAVQHMRFKTQIIPVARRVTVAILRG